MENMKLISVRVDPKDLDKLDELAKKTMWRKRSDLIQAAIRLMLVAGNKGLANKVCQFTPRWGDVVDEFKFEYHREHQ
jgi:metal-responsive CopG/Arc/MetJ family transcriptional regulator